MKKYITGTVVCATLSAMIFAIPLDPTNDEHVEKYMEAKGKMYQAVNISFAADNMTTITMQNYHESVKDFWIRSKLAIGESLTTGTLQNLSTTDKDDIGDAVDEIINKDQRSPHEVESKIKKLFKAVSYGGWADMGMSNETDLLQDQRIEILDAAINFSEEEIENAINSINNLEE